MQSVNADVATLKTSSASTALSIASIKLLTQAGSVSKQWKFSAGSKQVHINVSGLAKGTYFLEISDGVNIERQTLIVGGK